MSIIPCGICHGVCGGHFSSGVGWTYPLSSAGTGLGSPKLSDHDIERIARRVAELLRDPSEASTEDEVTL